jgi:4'-phosphopantetheinyl transferase
LSLEENRPSGNAGHASSGVEALASPEAETELWWCSITPDAARLDAFARWLSPAERARASRFGTPQLRDRYVMGRGTRRSILAGRLGTDPASVEIVRGMRGRPQLADASAFDFNISHTAGVAIVGITRRGRIGVDVERLDRTINVAGIERKFLTSDERSVIASLDGDARRQQVLTLWTCKEAMSKATGDALGAPFGGMDVTLDSRRALRSGPGAYRAEHWSLHAAAVPSDYVATIALWRPR